MADGLESDKRFLVLRFDATRSEIGIASPVRSFREKIC